MKKKKFLPLALSALLGLSLTGCKTADQETPAAQDEQTPAAADTDEEIREFISSMTTEQKLAQMMIVGLRSDGNNTKTAVEISQDYADLLN
jgi:hypothetical protein